MIRSLVRASTGSSAAGLAIVLFVVGFLCGGRRRPPEARGATARAQDSEAEPEEEVALTPPAVSDRPYRTFRLTQYWAAELVLDDTGEDLHDERGRFLARVSPASKHRLVTEGTGRLPGGRVLNVTGVQDRYRVLHRGSRGVGVKGRSLRPFLSIASDQGGERWKDERTRGGPLVPVATRCYIRELDGYRLPDGMVHDGWVWADDAGDAVYGAHLDLFVGKKEHALHLPAQVSVWFPGIEEIPPSYTYGLKEAKGPRGAYRKLRPPPPPRRIS